MTWQLLFVIVIIAGAAVLLVKRAVAQKRAFSVSEGECEEGCGCSSSSRKEKRLAKS